MIEADSEAEEEEDVSLPLMMALERLSQLGAAAFLLRRVQGCGSRRSRQLEREPAPCRQLAARARGQLREARPRFQVEKGRGPSLPSIL